MITNYEPDKIQELNAKTPSRYCAYGRYCVIDDENVSHESIPCVFLYKDAHYELSGQGVQFLSKLEDMILLREPTTVEGEIQCIHMKVDEFFFFPATYRASDSETFVETETGWVSSKNLPFPGYYERDGYYYAVG